MLENIDFYTNHYGKGSPLHEMRMLNIVKETNEDIFNILPSLPYSSDKVLFLILPVMGNFLMVCIIEEEITFLKEDGLILKILLGVK